MKWRFFSKAHFQRATAALSFVLMLLTPRQACGELLYTTNDGSITITGWSSDGREMIVPDVIDGLPVTRIARLTPMHPSPPPLVRRVVIADSVTNIAERAFYGWQNITNVVIGSGLSSIGSGAFVACHSLVSFEIAPANARFSSLNGVIYDKAQSALIAYPAGRMGTFNVPDGVIEIAEDAFVSNRFLPTITLPSSVRRIGPTAFASCIALTSVTNAAGLMDIDDEAFAGSFQLSRMPLGNNLANIGAQAFRGCGFTTIAIGPAVQSIGHRAFAQCGKLTTITVDGSNPLFSSLNGVLFDKSQTRLIQFPSAKTGNYTVPTGVREIGDSAFYAAFNVGSVMLPATVTNIGKSAFDGASKLSSINIPDGITKIEDRAFYRCSSLSSSVIPNGVTTIGDFAFSATKLPTVTIPESVTTIGHNAFSSLSIASIVIPNSVTNMGNAVFSNCRFLTSAAVGTGINRVPSDTFAGCMFLRNVTWATISLRLRTAHFRVVSSIPTSFCRIR